MTQKKDSKEDMIKYMNKTIAELTYSKRHLVKAYNYYHGKRDPEQFRHLEENYGIGTPTSVEFVPLVRKHIDVLIGEYLSTPTHPKISCKDSETLSNIFRNKQLEINKVIADELRKYLTSAINASIKGDPKITDKDIEKQLDTLVEATDRNYISEYEIAGQNLVEYVLQSRDIDLINKRKTLLTDLLVTGTCYYKVQPSPTSTNIVLRILNPLNTFIDRSTDSPYLKDSSRAVVREYLTKQQILAKYGDYIDAEHLKELDNTDHYGDIEGSSTYMRSYETIGAAATDGILGGFEISPSFAQENTRYFRTYPVYEVEWLKTEKVKGKFVTKRYCGIRINSNIFINIGEDENTVRSIDNPNNCGLSVNGIFFSDRNGDPYSLVLATANLQDKYDVLCFYRDNVIAESGSVGDFIDIAHLPVFLGSDIPERLLKYKAYKKSGMGLYDSSQEGAQLNTTFGGFDDTIKLNTIQAIDLAIQRVEETCSTITGVFREKLGGIEQRDAVSNVQVGVRQSTYITKQYYQLMDLMTREMLLDMINIAKIVYKNGISGTIILGERLNKIFTALPEHYTVTDFDINITDSAEVMQEQETLKMLLIELSKSGMADPRVLIEVATSKSLTKMKSDIFASLDKKESENSSIQQLSQQLEQLNNALKQATEENKKLQAELDKEDSTKLQLEREKIENEKQLKWFVAKSEDSYKTAKLESEMKRVELEGLQLLDNNHNNDEIKDN